MLMTELGMDEKFKKAAEVICKQGMVPFPVSDTAAQGFAKKITREKARQIMTEAEKAGLIHKAFHPGSRESSPETSICNCCKDCCDTLELWRSGTLPLINSTYHLAVIDEGACTGCGTCVEWCPTDAIVLNAEPKSLDMDSPPEPVSRPTRRGLSTASLK